MAPSAQSHSRNHSLLLLQKLLNLRDSASPLTLLLDTVEQSAAPLVKEFMGRAKVRPTCSRLSSRRPSNHACVLKEQIYPCRNYGYRIGDAYAHILLDRPKQGCVHFLRHSEEALWRRHIGQGARQDTQGAQSRDSLSLPTAIGDSHQDWTLRE